MLKLDLHIHSKYSEDGSGNILEISKILKKKGLDGMAITDHNTIEGGISALRVASKDFVVIPGIEISSKDGHIIALNVKENIPRNLTIEETIENIIDIGGLPIVPHLYRTLSGIKEKKLKKIKNKVPAIEVFNSCSVLRTNLKTMEIAKKYKLGGTGGSDSHIPSLVGEAYTIIDTNNLNIDSIISLIEKKKTWGEGNTLDLDYRRDRMVKSVKQFFERGLKRI
jgi:predicted metal-dependent phosphoesterase TrpH